MSDSATPGPVAPKAPLSLGSPRQEYWSGLPFPSPEDLPELRDGTHGLNLDLPYCRQILYPLSHQGSPFHFKYISIQILMDIGIIINGIAMNILTHVSY